LNVSAAIRTVLAADSTVAGLVGTRIYAELIPDKEPMPAIAFRRQGKFAHVELTGSVGSGEYTYDVSCWSDSYTEAQTLGEAVESALVDYSGTSAGVTVQHIWLDDADDVRYASPANRPLNRFGRIITVTVFTGT
jgi:hypothetical protein